MIIKRPEYNNVQTTTLQRIPEPRGIADPAKRRHALTAECLQGQPLAGVIHKARRPMFQLQPDSLRCDLTHTLANLLALGLVNSICPRERDHVRPGQTRHRLAQQAPRQ